MKRFHLILFAILAITTFLIVGFLTCSANAKQSAVLPIKHMHNMQLDAGSQLTSGIQQPPPVARYDLQQGLSLTEDFSSLAYNVTAIGQADPNGYGPAYLLNGITDQGYWVQVGVSFDWPYTVGGYSQGFGFNYEVFAPNQTSVYPQGGGGGMNPFSGPVNSGDTILLSLEFQGPYVIMFAGDWNTSSYAIQGFDAMGASYFQGTPYAPSDSNGYFTGPMTEWYHGDPSYRDSSRVNYTTNFGVSSAWMWMDQFDQLNPYWNGTWISSTPGPADYTQNVTQLQTLSFLGASESSNAYQLTTGTIVPLPTTITLFAADQSTTLTSSNYFLVSYVFNGQQLTAIAQNGTLIINADSGTQVTISGTSSASTGTEKWVLDSQAATVTISSGTKTTLCYYDLLSQQTSFAISSGGNPPNAVVTYYTAPDIASSKQAFVRVDLALALSTYQTILPAKGTIVSMSNSLPVSVTEQWATQENTVWTVQTPNQVSSRVIFNRQFLLGTATVQMNWQWANSGTTVQLTIPVIVNRAEGTGQRAASYSIDSDASVSIQPNAGTLTILVFMNSPHQVTVNYVKQYQLSLDSSAGNVEYVTPPTISGDNYWYDQGTPVNLVLNSIINRGPDTGERIQSYSVNGVQNDVTTAVPVSVLSLNAISSPQIVTQTTVQQFRLAVTNGSLEAVTNPPLAGDAGWYDNGTKVKATFDYSWNQTLGQSRTNAIGYATTQDDSVVLPRSQNGTFDVDVAMIKPQVISVSAVTQYGLSVSGGFNVVVSLGSPTKDSFYDVGTSLTVSSDYTGQLVNGDSRLSLVEYVLDGSQSNITRTETGRLSTPQITFMNSHNLVFNDVNQYLVTFGFTDTTGTHSITPDSFRIQTNSADKTDITTFASWIDAGSTFQLSKVTWQGVDVTPESRATYVVNLPLNETVPTRVYEVKLVVIDAFGIPISSAKVTCTLANGTQVKATTDSQGTVNLQLIPIGENYAAASNFGMSASTGFDASQEQSAALTVFASDATIALVAAVLLAIAIIVVGVVYRERRLNKITY